MTIFGVGGVVEEEVWTSLSDYSLAPAGPLGPAKSWPLVCYMCYMSGLLLGRLLGKSLGTRQDSATKGREQIKKA